MSATEWIALASLAFNAVVGIILFVGRLQFRVWKADVEMSLSRLLKDHNEEPTAHSNHALSLSLEDQFKTLLGKMNEIVTQLAVLNERLEIKVRKR